MNILSVDCSSSPVSSAIISDGKITSSVFSDIKLTHSQTLFPIIESTLSAAKLKFSEIDALGVSVGPGSFTGIRIGLSSVKGLAQPQKLKCVGVSSLLSSAYLFQNENAIICPVIDARCSQVYNALFDVSGGSVARLCEDRAIMIDYLINHLNAITDKKIILCCDAAETVYNLIKGQSNIVLAPKPLIAQNAVGVGLYAQEALNRGQYEDGKELMPIYLKLPQAERELKSFLCLF